MAVSINTNIDIVMVYKNNSYFYDALYFMI